MAVLTAVGVELDHVSVRYGRQVVLQDVSFRVNPGECVALTGPSGSGKSTILACIAGQIRPAAGRVLVGDTTVSDLNTAARARFRRRKLGLMFQSPGLLPELNIEENVALTLLFDGTPRRAALVTARAGLTAVGLEHHENRRVDEISMVEAQRVGLARALVRPDIDLLIADEPTASLDAVNARRVIDLVLARVRQVQVTAVIATHDAMVAAACDHVIEVADRNQVSVGS